MIDHAARFWSKVDKDGPVVREDLGPCWVWTGTLNQRRGGYGQFSIGHTKLRAHRFAWTLTHGDPPEDLVVMHKCDNAPCCNPEHLELGTQVNNLQDCRSKGRLASGDRNGARKHIERVQRGESRWNAKLTDDDVRRIRAAAGTHEEIAAALVVSRRTVGRVRQGAAWRHVQ